MSASGKIADKDSYDELTPAQAAIVDAKVEDPDRIQQEVADRANELLDERGYDDESVQRSYVSDVQNKYGHIIERETQLRRGHADPDARDEANAQAAAEAGDPFQGQLDQPSGWQSIADRPMSASPSDADRDETADANEQQTRERPAPDPTPNATADDSGGQTPRQHAVNVALGDQGRIVVELDAQAVEEIVLNGSLPDSLRRQVFDAVVRQAFSGD